MSKEKKRRFFFLSGENSLCQGKGKKNAESLKKEVTLKKTRRGSMINCVCGFNCGGGRGGDRRRSIKKNDARFFLVPCNIIWCVCYLGDATLL